MKNLFLISFAFLATLLIGCSGSDTYRGAWKAMNMNGEKFDIVFAEKSMTITDSTGTAETFEYSQNSVHLENSVETYGIRIADKGSFEINFPNGQGEDVGLIKDVSGNPIFSIGRNKYVKYQDVFRFY